MIYYYYYYYIVEMTTAARIHTLFSLCGVRVGFWVECTLLLLLLYIMRARDGKRRCRVT